MQSLENYTPDSRIWVKFETYTSSLAKKERRLLLRRLQSGHLDGRLMGGQWYLMPLA
jgi:hypothetical protein